MMDLRDYLASTGLGCLTVGVGILVGVLVGETAGLGSAFTILGVGLFYLGVFHTAPRRR